ncbi:NEDD8-activating enzyme E1 regulatory subunit AXR1 isoform X2 [Brachypodium distachyon]|uniref:NEDD8-activating enzyme E1 regulatory subunit AXR1 isoform X2 n=1 Tax=Brachypodium distachyon TaxID=15368 RepID=UPI00052FE3AB|nr:NEDD8-activating enzyme E1 regulatory subunit AXR1 isoform X2 [Brachypodium distachyon]|eukprot:XP_010227671.1 NEDD8-activating enzyme E1 regulatory subunit AXR1 isoform X2 [Brachypodium distachyon]
MAAAAVAVAEPKTKYDRQLRIWGDQGQAALEKASICLLNSGPTGTEALKNLVLGGIGSVTVVDGSKVEPSDLGNNFLLNKECLGQSRAQSVCSFLQELNDAVKVKYVEESPGTMIDTNPSFFSQFTVVIATQLPESSLLKLDGICRAADIVLVAARSYGLTGLVRVSVKEHCVIESKPDHFLDDLRLHNPWTELKQFAKSIDICDKDPVVHKHTPYIVILVRLAEKWADAHDGKLPSTRQEKREFKDLIRAHMLNVDEENYKEAVESSYKVSVTPGISTEIRQIIDDSSSEVNLSSSDFWVLVAALKEFIANEGNGDLPLEGTIPDMTSQTEYYVSLQKIYQAKAETDCLAMEHRVKNILKRIGRHPDSISRAYIKTFCKNARKLRVCRYRSMEEEFNAPVISEVQKYFADEDSCFAMNFYILLRAVDRLAANYSRLPGIFDSTGFTSEIDEDVPRLKVAAVSVLSDMGLNGTSLSEDLVTEVCRFAGAEIHPVAAFIGGVASQEVIKLVTKQFVPLMGTFIFNGIDLKSQVLAL